MDLGHTMTTRHVQGRFEWTEELRGDLMGCFERSSPQRRGYMARLHGQFAEMHPDLATRFSRQQLRDYVAFLKRRGFVTSVPPAELQHQSPFRRRITHVGSGAPEIQGATPVRNCLKTKTIPKSQDIQRVNSQLVDGLPEDCDLWQISCAVYEAAEGLVSSRVPIMPARRGQDTGRMTRLDGKIQLTRRLASRIQCVIDYIASGRKFTTKVRMFAKQLRTSHHTLNKLKLQTIKQRLADKIRVLAEAKRKLKSRERSIWQNSMFLSDPSRLFKQQQPAPRGTPTLESVEEFWKGIYEKTSRLNVDTPGIRLITEYCENTTQHNGEECPPISADEVNNAIKGTKNFSAPGWDGITNFWWKKFTSIHHHLARIFTAYIKQEQPIPHWLVEGRTVLIPKSGDLSDPKNYRPITCLNTVYKLFTTILNNRTTTYVEPVWRQIYEQRGCKVGVSGCKENLLIDRCVCQDSIQYKRNLSMAWLDYKKAFDSTSHELLSLLLKCLRVHPHIVRCIEELMPLWKTRFLVQIGKRRITSSLIQFQRGVYQGDSLSPLLFCISLLPLSVALRKTPGYSCGPPNGRVHTVTHLFYLDDLKVYASGEDQLQRSLNIAHVYSRDVGMEFGLDKCAVVHLHRGRSVDITNDMELVDGSIIRYLEAEETYAYLGVPQRHIQDAQTTKRSITINYRRLLRRIWSSELLGRNKVAATNMLAVPPVLYTFGVLRWTVDELRSLDRGTRKMLCMHRSLHPRSSVERLYLPRSLGGRGLMSLECLHNRIVLDTACRVVNRTEDPLMLLVHSHEIEGKGAFLYQAAERAARGLGLVFGVGRNGAQDAESIINVDPLRLKAHIRTSEVRMLMEGHTRKPLHGQFFKNVQQNGLSVGLTYGFLTSPGLKSETEGFLFACQDGVVNTLHYRRHVLHAEISSSLCRACGCYDETLMHLLSACPKYAVSSYIYRHNAALRVLYYHLRSVYGVDETPVLPYVPTDIESVVGNESCRIYWNYSFPTSRQLTANKPDIVLIDFDDKAIFVIEFSAPAEKNIAVKEDEKRTKYQDLLFEIRKGYRGFSIKLVILIIGVLGGARPTLLSNIKSIPACRPYAENILRRMQKAVLLGSLRLLRSHDTTML